MKRLLPLAAGFALVAFGATAQAATGEALFKQHCAVCHPNGGNIVKPQHPIDRKHLATMGITTWDGVVKVMRKPAAGMPAFDSKKISDADARAIAEYILATFK